VRLRLYVVHGSHPCAAVKKAMALKGLRYDVLEWPPPMHAPLQWILFGARTVPGLKLTDDRGVSEKISGSRAIMRRLEQLAPDPPLFPSDPGRRTAVEEAEEWCDASFQQVARNLIWAAMSHSPGALVSYSQGSRIPLPAGAIRLSAPLIARLSSALNKTGDDVALRDLRSLPGELDRIDSWIAAGTIGDREHPNAADLQIGATIRLLMTIADVRPVLGERPCAVLARDLFDAVPGELPAGSLPVR
jgi:glutathione S-transferase